MRGHHPFPVIPDHWKRPPLRTEVASLPDALVAVLGRAANAVTEMPEFDPFIRGGSTGAVRTLREMRMIENVGVCRYRLTPLGRALRTHLQNGEAV